MRIQEAIVRQLQQTTTATYALAGTRIYWAITAKDPTLPFVRVRKAAHTPITSGILPRRLPATATLEIVAYAKSQDAAADLADAITADLISWVNADMPATSPVTAGAVRVQGIKPGDEVDLVSEDALALNIFAESREFFVHYR